MLRTWLCAGKVALGMRQLARAAPHAPWVGNRLPPPERGTRFHPTIHADQRGASRQWLDVLFHQERNAVASGGVLGDGPGGSVGWWAGGLVGW
jgi:hypothetical protein